MNLVKHCKNLYCWIMYSGHRYIFGRCKNCGIEFGQTTG